MQKVVLVTGASSGLGLATALHLSEKGFNVFGTSRDPNKYKKKLPFDILSLEITNRDSINECVNQVIKRSNKIDILINNAGRGITGPIEEIDNGAVIDNFETNCFGPINMCQAVLPHMRNQRYGLIINITSIAGHTGLPFRGIYSASKSALSIITESLRMEVKKFGIDVCTVAPGDFATNIASRRYHSPIIKNSPYEKYLDSLNTMNSHVDDGNPPEQVAILIEKIISKRKTNVHYQVGPFIQKLSKMLKKILPSRIFEKLIMNHYNL